MPKQGDKESPKSEATSPPIPESGGGKAEIGTRLERAVKLGGGNKVVSAKSGIPLRTLGNLLDGQEMKVGQLVRIAEACGVSVDWLATGRLPVHPLDRLEEFETVAGGQPPPELDEALLRDVLVAVEMTKRPLPPGKKAEVIATAYAMCQGQDAEFIYKTAFRLVRLATYGGTE